MMLLAATLSAATRTKSCPWIPIKYSIMYITYELKSLYNTVNLADVLASTVQITQQKFQTAGADCWRHRKTPLVLSPRLGRAIWTDCCCCVCHPCCNRHYRCGDCESKSKEKRLFLLEDVSMNEGTPRNIMAESDNISGSQRRRSPRLSSPPQANRKTENKMALDTIPIKRSITVRKIAPRKTTLLSEHNKENTPRSTEPEVSLQKKHKVSTPGHVPGRGPSSSAKKKKKTPAMPSPILPSSPPPSRPQQPATDPEDEVWSQKVRRSYSRLSENSFNSPNSRETLFGFEKLKTPEVVRAVGQSKTALVVSGSLSGLNSFTTMLEADDCGSAFSEPDPNIPGVTVVREKRRRKKVQQIDNTELEALAAKMNAEFEEAEEFELVVE